MSYEEMVDIVLKEESFKIIGLCMEVHRRLGMGFNERVYKEALEVEFKEAQLPFFREKKFGIIGNFGKPSFEFKRVVF